MSAISYYTAEGLKKIERRIRLFEKCDASKSIHRYMRQEIKGDLSENAEYDAAKKHKECLK
jgi:transcription elongation factor GreA